MIDSLTKRWKAGLQWDREYEPGFTHHHAAMAFSNAMLWLTQAAKGEIPHGGMQPMDMPTSTSFNDYTVEERPGRND